MNSLSFSDIFPMKLIYFNLKDYIDVPKLIEDYMFYYNNQRPPCSLNYKTPIQFKIESGF